MLSAAYLLLLCGLTIYANPHKDAADKCVKKEAQCGGESWQGSTTCCDENNGIGPKKKTYYECTYQTDATSICSRATSSKPDTSGPGGDSGSSAHGGDCHDACGYFASGTDAWVKTGTKLTMLTLQYDGVNYNDIATDDGRLRLPMMPWGGGAYKQPLEKLLIDSPGPNGAEVVRMALTGKKMNGLTMQLRTRTRPANSNGADSNGDADPEASGDDGAEAGGEARAGGAPRDAVAASVGVDVRIGQLVDIVAADGAKFPADLVVTLTDPATAASSTVMFHSSCSYPIGVGDRYGSITVFQHRNTAGCQSEDLDDHLSSTTATATTTTTTDTATATTAATATETTAAPASTRTKVTLSRPHNDGNGVDDTVGDDDGDDNDGILTPGEPNSADDDDDDFTGSLCVNGVAGQLCVDLDGKLPVVQWGSGAPLNVREDAQVGAVVATLSAPSAGGVSRAPGEATFRVVADTASGMRSPGQPQQRPNDQDAGRAPAASAAFTVDPSAGTVMVANALDYEVQPTHTMMVMIVSTATTGTETVAGVVNITLNVLAVPCADGVTFSATGTFPCRDYTVCTGGADFEVDAATSTTDRTCAITKRNVAGDARATPGSEVAVLAADQMIDAGDGGTSVSSSTAGMAVGVTIALLFLVGMVVVAFQRQRQQRYGVGAHGVKKGVAAPVGGDADAYGADATYGGDAVYAQIDENPVQDPQHGYTYEIPQAISAAAPPAADAGHHTAAPTASGPAAAHISIGIADPLYMFSTSTVSSTGHEAGTMNLSQPAPNPLLLQSSFEAASDALVVEHALYMHAAGVDEAARGDCMLSTSACGKTEYDLAEAAAVTPAEGGVESRHSRGSRMLNESGRSTSYGSALDAAGDVQSDNRSGFVYGLVSQTTCDHNGAPPQPALQQRHGVDYELTGRQHTAHHQTIAGADYREIDAEA